MKRFARIVAVGAAVLIAAAGCANAAKPAAQADSDGAAAQLAALHQRITGSVADRSAGALLAYVNLQKPLRECMKAKGLSYTPPRFDDPFDGWPAPRPMDYFAELLPVSESFTGRGLYLTEDYTAPRPAAIAESSPPAGYAEAVTACMPPPKDYEEVDFAAGALALSRTMEIAIGKAINKPQLRDLAAAWPKCMAEKGYAVPNRAGLTAHVRSKHFAPIVDPKRQTLAVSAVSEAAATARSAELAAARADATCRQKSYPLALTLAKPALAAFAKDQSGQLAAVDAAWADLRRRADAARPHLNG